VTTVLAVSGGSTASAAGGGAQALETVYPAGQHGLAMVAIGLLVLTLALASEQLWRRLRVAAWTGRLPGRFGALPDETLPSHERPRGYKAARLVADAAGGGSFLGLTLGGLYGHDDRAVCEVLAGALPPPRRWGRRRRPTAHEAPDLTCTCGFYAFHGREGALGLLTARPPISRQLGVVLLEVDLSGTVIEFDRGFRAGQQRVLGVQVPRWCVPCAASGTARPARVVAGLSGAALADSLRAELPRYPPVYRLALSVHQTALLERLAGRAALRAVCDEHTPVELVAEDAAPGDRIVLELADLAARLGTEVRWLDDDAFDVAGFVEAMSWLPPGNSRVA
jgi:hypothetical protein